jgi:hypothetical protein
LHLVEVDRGHGSCPDNGELLGLQTLEVRDGVPGAHGRVRAEREAAVHERFVQPRQGVDLSLQKNLRVPAGLLRLLPSSLAEVNEEPREQGDRGADEDSLQLIGHGSLYVRS